MDTQYTVGQYLTQRLEELGLGHLFSIAGDYTIEWINKHIEPSSIELIEEVNELNAGYAADGYARLKGIGAMCFTYSAGTLSAVNAVAASYAERIPVVVVNGAPSIQKRLTAQQTGFTYHHMIDGETDLNIYKNITAAAIKIDNPELAPRLIDYALTECISQKRPAYIELLEDMVEQPCAAPQGKLTPLTPIPLQDNVDQAIDKVQQALSQAERPIVWLGAEVDRMGLHEEANALIRKLNLPYVTELISKAVFSENDPLFTGVFDGQASSEVTQKLVNESDFILGLGVWLSDINSLGQAVNYDKTALISWDTVKLGTYFVPQVPLANFIDELNQKPLSNLSTCAIPSEAPNSSEQFSGDISYQGFYDFIQSKEYINDNVLIGSDASLNFFGSLLLKVGTPRGFVAQPTYSSIGYIGPAATGMSLAKQDHQRVFVFSGDGGFQMTPQCLSTQTRFKLNPIIFVMDNGVYGVEQWLYDAEIFSSDQPFFDSCILHQWDYCKLADVFGCKGWKANTYEELNEAILGALENLDSPSLIQVRVPPKSLPNNAKWKKK
ncbi:thiamine pyrophosphate-dependent enzyme [Pseudoalteromonas luteoviolacea]|uniref:alpha-keto acid decarboxylase family protein n=1 Tax=Pseudoalteromonas luteoviolacea TaxID=43657 RepID=UPI001EEED873|nr:thiamine pyrophosphate-dependent enzyme [Pseudoalteromonas luteoviolacea]MCF6441174.1 thiamine pyrophosphate-dependent enzyme [Pseudoalteromonas luteoviolacea]